MVKLEAAQRLKLSAAGVHDEIPGPCTIYFSEEHGREPMKFRSTSSKGNWEFSKKCRDMGSRTHMRIGHYSVVTFSDGDVGISKDYPVAGWEADQSIKPGSEYWESSKRDRMRQLKDVTRALKGLKHPLKSEVMKDIKDEAEYLNQ